MSATATVGNTRALPIQTSPEAAGIFPNADPSAMSPDALMVYCQKRLQDCDTQINTAFTQQELHNKSSAAITKLVTALQNGTQYADLGDDQKKAISQAFDDAYQATAGDPKAQQAIKDEWTTFAATAHTKDWSDSVPPDPNSKGDASVDGTKELQPMIDSLNQTQKDLNSGAELSMINLQTLMSQRQTAVSVCTNLVQKMNDTMNQITANYAK